MKTTTKIIINEKLVSMLAIDYNSCSIQLCLASILEKNQDIPTMEKMQLSKSVADDFRGIIIHNIEKLKKSDNDKDLRLIKYDAAAMNRPDEIEYLELSEANDIVAQFSDISTIESLDIFKADNKFINGLRFYTISAEIDGKKIVFFRLYSSKSELSRASYLGIKLSETVYDRVSEPLFLFDNRIDCIAYDGTLFILSKDKFQKIFRYFEKLREAGIAALKAISDKIKIENFDALSKLCEGHLLKLAKLRNIAAKDYIKTVTIADIKKVIKEFSLDNVKIIKKDGEERLLFDPKADDKWAILRVLDDDYLGSIMTNYKYEANSKRLI
jgi:hypothetical protein